MFRLIIKRLKNGRLATLGAFLFAALMTFSLCGLHSASQSEIRKYEEAYRTIPVTLTVTSLTGLRSDDLELPQWVVSAFTDYPMDDLVKDLQVKMTVPVSGDGITQTLLNGEQVSIDRLVGLSVAELDPDLARDEEAITWFSGYDGSIFASEGEELYLVIPESMMPEDGSIPAVSMTFSYDNAFDYFPRVTYQREFVVIGTHNLGHRAIYCPYFTSVRLYKDMGMPLCADSVRATVANNDWLWQIRFAMSDWFVEPSITAERVPWDYSYYYYYPYALDIDDSQLIRAGEVMQTNVAINKISTALVFTLSAGAGFLVGFLLINRRKREIMLMRTMGTPDGIIFRDFALEQMLCATAGALLGGAAFLWMPLWRVVLFLVIYFAGLALSLFIFLKKNLLTGIKED